MKQMPTAGTTPRASLTAQIRFCCSSLPTTEPARDRRPDGVLRISRDDDARVGGREIRELQALLSEAEGARKACTADMVLLLGVAVRRLDIWLMEELALGELRSRRFSSPEAESRWLVGGLDGVMLDQSIPGFSVLPANSHSLWRSKSEGFELEQENFSRWIYVLRRLKGRYKLRKAQTHRCSRYKRLYRSTLYT